MPKESLRKTEDQEKKVYFKYLRLITPEFAQKLGISAETPVFISPTISHKEVCRECGEPYGPLIYQAGVVIEAHHWHGGKGGIYYLPLSSIEDDFPFHPSAEDKFYRMVFERKNLSLLPDSHFPGWIATLEPEGQKKGNPFFSTLRYRIEGIALPLRSPKVHVRRILAFCVQGGDCFHQELIGGEVFGVNADNRFLYPLCEWHAAFTKNAPVTKRFDFIIKRSGEVLFSRPNE